MQNKLLKLASEASKNAYAPYSNFKVGACALFKDGQTYIGCNVENATFTSQCAERNAMSSAVVNGQNPNNLVAIAIYSPNSKLCYPCGSCRQWISEFSKNTEIIIENKDGNPTSSFIKDLLPHSFEL